MSAPVHSRPVYSMTGFARVSGRISDLLSWNLSLKSVNHRFLDLHMRMPAGAEPLEMRLRRLLKEKVLRGHLEVTLTVERGLRPSAHFDRDLLQGYIAAFRAAAAENATRAAAGSECHLSPAGRVDRGNPLQRSGGAGSGGRCGRADRPAGARP